MSLSKFISINKQIKSIDLDLSSKLFLNSIFNSCITNFCLLFFSFFKFLFLLVFLAFLKIARLHNCKFISLKCVLLASKIIINRANVDVYSATMDLDSYILLVILKKTVEGIILAAAELRISAPTAVDPVNAIFAIR